MDYQEQYPPAPPRTPPPKTPTQSPGQDRSSLHTKSPRLIPPPPLHSTPRTPSRRTLTQPTRSPGAPGSARQPRPPPPPKRRDDFYSASEPNLIYGMAPPYPDREPPFAVQELVPTQQPSQRRDRSREKLERRRNHKSGRKIKTYHEIDEHFNLDITQSFHEERAPRRSNGGDFVVTPKQRSNSADRRYSRAHSTPVVGSDNYRERRRSSKSPGRIRDNYNDGPPINRSNSSKSYLRDNSRQDQFNTSNSSKSYMNNNFREESFARKNSSTNHGYTQQSLLDPSPWRPDPSSTILDLSERSLGRSSERSIGRSIGKFSERSIGRSTDRFTDNGSTSYSDHHVLRVPNDDRTFVTTQTTFDRCIDSLMCIFPKVEPLPWTTYFLLSLWCALP